MDFDDFMGEKVLITSFSSAVMVGTLVDYSDDYIELDVEGEVVEIPIEPIRNIRIIE